MGVKLYALDMSPPVRACMMTLGVFNVPFEKIIVNVPAGEHLTPEYLKKNPLHTIPVLEDGDITIHDSHAILTYIADTYGKDDSWYPKDLKKRTLVNQKLFFNAAVMFQKLRNITYNIIIKGKKTIEQEQLDGVTEGYEYMEAFLSRTKYIAGDHVTIADIAILSTVSTQDQILPIDGQKRYPKLKAWLEELKATPYCKKYNEEGAKALGAFVKKSVSS
uniref:SFRICE032845.2 n=1 Tax=Spodoptera frugiperda TaxID=7108 RepID=A0A2H1WKF1_SPOFR